MMSRIRKDRAVILKTFPYSETSVIVMFLAREHGKIRCMARGARRSRSKFSGTLLTGSICDIVFSYRVSRGLQTLTDIETVYSLDTGRETLERVCIFQAAMEVLNYSLFEGEPDAGPFDLIENFILSLKESADPFTLFFAFEIRLLRLTGYFPHIYECGCCRADTVEKGFSVDISSGEIRCQDCSRRGMTAVSGEAAEKIYDIDVENLSEMLNIELNKKLRGEIGRMLHGIFRLHVEGYRAPASLGLLKGVI
ncbi:MAG: DNA repair protein RecO [Candidatus Latescibacteria bacterium]|nr:DNA repair protein RecO [bacterium]MBD3425098.1 DNA repair protein RecO [Candidatus Latescibacterota bacterium]